MSTDAFGVLEGINCKTAAGMQEPRKAFIDKLLAATGMKYEKAFGR